MPIALQGTPQTAVGVESGGLTTATVATPTSTVGDLILVACAADPNLGASDLGGTLTLLDTQTNGAFSGGVFSRVWYRWATGGEGSFAIRAPGVGFLAACAVAYRGADPLVNPVSSSQLSTGVTSPAGTVTRPGAMVLHVAAIRHNTGSQTITPPGGMTERVDYAPNVSLLHVAEVLQAAAGTTGTKTSTPSGGTPAAGAAFTVVIEAPLVVAKRRLIVG